jgi:hypothetical protein
MKGKLALYAVLISAFIFTNLPSLKAQTYANAVDYMTAISDQFSKIMSETWDYTSAVAHGKNAKKVESNRKELIKTIADAKKKIGSMPGYDDDTAYRDSVVAFLTMDYNIMNNDYAKIVDMEEIAEQSYDQMETYLKAQELANAKLDRANDNLSVQQKLFATDHNINLTENKDKVVKKLESSDKVIKYYNIAYLIFFKSYKQEAYLLDAIIKNDLTSIEQNKNTLLASSTSGLAMLDTLKSFNGDANLKIACKAALTFYKTEADTKIQDAIDYYTAKSKFEKIKAAFDAKAASSRTKTDVDEYNAAVSEYNKAGTKYNTTNTELNTKRTAAIEGWNKAGEAFLDKHVPKYK